MGGDRGERGTASSSPPRGTPPLGGLESRKGTYHVDFFLPGLVKAVNTAVDLIVAHFGTSRDPGVKVGCTVRS